MPIPPFDGILNVLPPHVGDPAASRADLSPYPCTMEEVCDRFATSGARKDILDGFLNFRAELLGLGIRGFQWLDGSFLEDIETQEGRAPGDIDVVTFVSHSANPAALHTALAPKIILLNRAHVKSTYHVDHIVIPLGSAPAVLVDEGRYWYGLFSHRRDRVWKGMLVVNLVDKSYDDAARKVLGGKP
jgi:hypothetical protein